MSPGNRVVILGGGGFIGSHLAEELVSTGFSVRAFDKAHTNWDNLSGVSDRVEFCEGDFTNRMDIRRALNGCSIVVHLVSSTLPSNSNENPEYDVESNVLSSIRLLDEARAAKIGRVLFVSSGGTVYGRVDRTPISEDHPTDPLCSYGIAKLAIEKYIGLYRSLHGIRGITLRLANPYGERQNPASGQGVVAAFLDRARVGEPVEIWGDGEVVRDYVYIGDAVRAMRLVLESDTDEVLFNVGSGTGVSLNALLEAIRTVTGRPVEVVYRSARPLDVPINVLDTSRLRKAVKWTPRTSLHDGLKNTWAWMLGGASTAPPGKTAVKENE